MIACLTFDVDAEAPILAAGARYAAHLGPMSHQQFGPRVGVPRILELLAEYDLPATFFVPGLTADRHPEAVALILEAGHEVAHHSYAHVPPVDQTEAEERRDLERGLEALARHGVEPRGYRCPMWEPAYRTPRLLAEYGLRYDSSLFDDDRPYVLEIDLGRAGRRRLDGAGQTSEGGGSAGAVAEIVELPVSWELDDWEQYAYLPRPDVGSVIESPAKALDLWTRALDGYRRHDALFVLVCHPFLSGRPARLEALRQLVEHALAAGDVEFRGCAEVAEKVTGPRRALEPVAVEPGLHADG